jgi:hypothetical protein
MIEREQIEVTTWADGPDNPQFMNGRAFCPNGCDPRFRRIVVAADYNLFRSVCRDEGWNHNRVIFVSTADRFADMRLRGVVIHPDMIKIVSPVGPELHAIIRIGVARFGSTGTTIEFPPVPDLPEDRTPETAWGHRYVPVEPERPYIDRESWNEAEELIRALNPAEYGRTLPPEDRWGDSMRWVPSPDGEEPAYI